MEKTIRRLEGEFEGEVERIRGELERMSEAEERWEEAAKARARRVTEMTAAIGRAIEGAPSRVTVVELERVTPEFKFVESQVESHPHPHPNPHRATAAATATAVQVIWRVFGERVDEATARTKPAAGSTTTTTSRVVIGMEREAFVRLIGTAFDTSGVATPAVLSSSAKEAIELFSSPSSPPTTGTTSIVLLWCRAEIGKTKAIRKIPPMDTMTGETVALRVMTGEGKEDTGTIIIPTEKVRWTMVPEFAGLIERGNDHGAQESETRHIESIFTSLVSFSTARTLTHAHMPLSLPLTLSHITITITITAI